MTPKPRNDPPPEAQPVAPLEVSYERPLPWSARRGAFHLIVFLLFLNVLATTSITWGPSALNSFKGWYEARQAAKRQAVLDARNAADAKAVRDKRRGMLATTLPVGLVVYTEDPVEAESLLRNKTGYSCVGITNADSAMGGAHLPVIWQGPPELQKLSSYLPAQLNDLSGTIFLHERHAAGGPTRLIWVYLSSKLELNRNLGASMTVSTLIARRSLETCVFSDPAEPGGAPFLPLWSHHLTILQPSAKQRVLEYPSIGSQAEVEGRKTIVRNPGDLLRVLAGRIDPTRPDHLMIVYTLEGRPGTLDITLLTDDRLRVETHTGQKTTEVFDAQQGSENWNPHLK